MSKRQSSLQTRQAISRWMELLLDCLCCIAMAIGAMWAFDPLYPERFHSDIPTMALHATVVVAILALGTRKKWILPSVIGGGLVLTLIYVLIAGRWTEMTDHISGLIDWWMNQFPVKNKFNTDINIALVKWIVHSLITAALYLCVRGIKQIWVMIISAAFLFWIIMVSGFNRNNLMALLWLATGLFPLMARYASASMPWMKGKSKEQRKESRKQWRKPAWYVYATAAVLTAICTVASLLILPVDTEPLQSRPLANIAEDIQSAIGIDNQMDTGFQEMGLSSLGLQPDEHKLGGDIWLDDKTNVLKVKTQTPSLLKGRVYTIYDGESWTAEKTRYYRLGSGLFTEEHGLAFDVSLPATNEGQAMLAKMNANVGMTITVLQPNSSMLFTAGRLLGFEEMTPERNPVLFNMASEVYVNSVPVGSAYKYSFTSQVFSPSSTLFSNNVNALLKEAANSADDRYNTQEFKDTYLNLPPLLPAIVQQKAEEYTQAASGEYKKMVALEAALRSKYGYTLTPGETPDGEDFVGYFLQTGKGYCVHFASAMTMMARTLGIPSRMVVGYGLEQDQKGDIWYARRKNAHAWTECYFEGLGWVTFDPTANSPYADLNKDDDPNMSTSVTESTKFDDTAPTGTETSAVIDQSGETTPAWILYTMLSVLLIAALVGVTVWMLLRLRYSETAYIPENVRARIPGWGDQVDHYYTDMVRQLKLLHYVPKNRETMKQFAKRVELGVGLEPDAMRLVFDIVMRWRYGEMEPTEEEVVLVETAHQHLEKRLYDELNAVMYFIRRRLML